MSKPQDCDEMHPLHLLTEDTCSSTTHSCFLVENTLATSRESQSRKCAGGTRIDTFLKDYPVTEWNKKAVRTHLSPSLVCVTDFRSGFTASKRREQSPLNALGVHCKKDTIPICIVTDILWGVLVFCTLTSIYSVGRERNQPFHFNSCRWRSWPTFRHIHCRCSSYVCVWLFSHLRFSRCTDTFVFR